MSLWGNCLKTKQKGGDGLRREAAVDRGDPTTASPGGHHFQENFRIINVSFYLYKPFHSHGEHAFWICCHQEVDSAIAGFEPGSQPPRSAAEILLATLAQVLTFFLALMSQLTNFHLLVPLAFDSIMWVVLSYLSELASWNVERKVRRKKRKRFAVCVKVCEKKIAPKRFVFLKS